MRARTACFRTVDALSIGRKGELASALGFGPRPSCAMACDARMMHGSPTGASWIIYADSL